MRCINCGRELPPDTAECPYCLERESQKNTSRMERRKILLTLVICCLVLAVIAACVLIFLPDTSFRRSMDNANGSYEIAALCESSPNEAADSRYQLVLLDAVNDIENRYSEQTCGYNQTVQALRQIYSVPNPIVSEKAEDVWADVERMRFFQLLNHKRTEKGESELTWNDDIARAAESLAYEYAEVGLDYQQNAERIVKNVLSDTDKIKVSSLLNTVNAQDALVKYEEDSSAADSSDLISGNGIALVGVDAKYSAGSGLWSFFIVTKLK